MSDEGEMSDDLGDEINPMGAMAGPLMKSVLSDVAKSRHNADGLLGYFRDYPDRSHTGPTLGRDKEAARDAVRRITEAQRAGKLTWRHLIESEVAEVFTENEPEKLRKALVCLAAQSVAWVEALDRRKDEKRIVKKQAKQKPSWFRDWFRKFLGVFA